MKKVLIMLVACLMIVGCNEEKKTARKLEKMSTKERTEYYLNTLVKTAKNDDCKKYFYISEEFEKWTDSLSERESEKYYDALDEWVGKNSDELNMLEEWVDEEFEDWLEENAYDLYAAKLRPVVDKYLSDLYKAAKTDDEDEFDDIMDEMDDWYDELSWEESEVADELEEEWAEKNEKKYELIEEWCYDDEDEWYWGW